MTPGFSEALLEEATLDWFKDYQCLNGEIIALEGPCLGAEELR